MECRKCGATGGWNFSEWSWCKYKWCLSCFREYQREGMKRVRENFLETRGIEYKDYIKRWQEANFDKCRVIRERYHKANMKK